MTGEPRFSPVASLLDAWRDSVLSGEPPTLFAVGDGELSRLEIGPGLVTLIGGAPGSGKTALTMQLTCEALARRPGLKVLVCNVEMSPTTLLDRQLARLSGIDARLIRHRRLGAEHADDLERGLNALEAIADRLAFVRPPFDLANVARSADDFDAELLVLDYIQRIGPPGEHGDQRSAISKTMDYIRRFADAGTAVIVVAALARSKDKAGRSSYAGDGLSLASFRETSELEYGADDAFILAPLDPDGGGSPSRVLLKHLKSRHGEAVDLTLDFDKPRQRFTVAPPASSKPKGKADPGKAKQAIKISEDLRKAWNETAPAKDDEDDEEEEPRP